MENISFCQPWKKPMNTCFDFDQKLLNALITEQYYKLVSKGI